ncbi:hypothetical protein SAMD00019534_007620 [Acytostelium subglobosum LB1]|uniref:hypothetical protein n=1 Tax=Acytostelium subglobosum LB1 TaxID=1410327 RepID=UPI0006449FCA|nr:hypothetical protein SAMD00019534_007620 [Acytostelium subglobosum LB1]GAM17587.1 hypothetical protein SAMD00019534_007620 [Acytostelium subglobosum LB1]|eukprot:XP_012759649.1 hypothetical protein SAMD00019534_007620 [Acytostelium subglobosum LB1]
MSSRSINSTTQFDYSQYSSIGGTNPSVAGAASSQHHIDTSLLLATEQTNDGNDANGGGPPKTQKYKERRSNQNVASRNYRQRKKLHIKEMEDRLHQLMVENETLKSDMSKFGSNPTELMRIPPDMGTQMAQVRKTIISIDQAIRNGEPDAVLSSLLKDFYVHKQNSITYREKEIEKLTMLGFKPLTNPWSDFVINSNHSDWWKHYSIKANISKEQNQNLSNIWHRYCEEEVKLQKDLTEVDEKIQQFYLSKVFVMPNIEDLLTKAQSTSAPLNDLTDSDRVDTSEILEFTFNLERLKQVFIRGCRMLMETSKQMSKYLNVRQEAMLVVLLDANSKYVLSNLEMANNLWEQLSQTKQGSSSSTSVPSYNNINNQQQQQQHRQSMHQQHNNSGSVLVQPNNVAQPPPTSVYNAPSTTSIYSNDISADFISPYQQQTSHPNNSQPYSFTTATPYNQPHQQHHQLHHQQQQHQQVDIEHILPTLNNTGGYYQGTHTYQGYPPN